MTQWCVNAVPCLLSFCEKSKVSSTEELRPAGAMFGHLESSDEYCSHFFRELHAAPVFASQDLLGKALTLLVELKNGKV